MKSPPAATQPATQEAAAAGVARQAKTTLKLSSRVKILNNSRNTSGCIRRRDAEFFLAEGRAVYAGRDPMTGRDHLRLVETHPTNRADALEAVREDQNGFDQYREGFVFWNGDTGARGTHQPGEVVS
jgi:hypothetical protein